MAKSKLEELYEVLSEKDRNLFELYLESPFFKCDGNSKKLFEALLNQKQSGPKFKSELYNKVFGDVPYDDKAMRYCISNLNKHLENFLIIRQVDKNESISKQILSRVFADQDCQKALLLTNNESGMTSELADSDALLEKFQNAELNLNYYGKKLNSKSTPDYSGTLFYLDAFYLIKKLQLSCELTNLANILQKQQQIHLLDELKNLCQTEPYTTVPSIQIYYHILQFLTDLSNEQAFIKSLSLVKEHSRLFKPSEVFELYQYIKNYCVRKINQGNSDYIKILFEIYKAILSNKPLMKHDYLSQWEFKNMVSISLRLNEKKWCEEFITKYINYLKPEERDNALAYNLAYSWFINDDYKKSIRKLQEVELKDIFYQLDARVILLKCYFELDETESFFYQVSSFRLFLLRNKSISEYQKTIYRNLIKFLAAITRAGTSKAKLKKIRTEVEKEKNVADIKWLYAKIEIALGE
ncbi:MAG: hypothetical protein IPP71_00805 [Bacteroidetes bacterium]|nr:hypothetical protein [Bacteroidota bacterium]